MGIETHGEVRLWAVSPYGDRRSPIVAASCWYTGLAQRDIAAVLRRRETAALEKVTFARVVEVPLYPHSTVAGVAFTLSLPVRSWQGQERHQNVRVAEVPENHPAQAPVLVVHDLEMVVSHDR